MLLASTGLFCYLNGPPKGKQEDKMRQLHRPYIAGMPQKQGLYDPANEHDNCGMGFIADIKNRKSHEIVRDGIQILINLDYDIAKTCLISTIWQNIIIRYSLHDTEKLT